MVRNGTPATSIEASPYRWPHNSSLHKNNTALVIIDMQVDFCAPGGYLDHQGIPIDQSRAIIPAIRSLLDAFRDARFPVYHTREGHRPDLSTLSSRELLRSRNNPSGKGIGDEGPLGRLLVRGEKGHAIIPELTPRPTEPVIDKPGRSAFQYTDFKLLLDNRGIKNLVICGVTTDVCVSSTMRDANDMGFDCVLVSDAAAAAEQSLHNSTIDSIQSEGGIFGAVTTTKGVLSALQIDT
ncbi:putative Isochorismatase-like domain-containing protein [Seiridium unicorne]|uniref:Isochorismatase-like domain-containing protein n=1 Tax=Seiridium unicorne TaxID=138068 RepID=A0ABR2VE98_9PEZI